LTAEQIDAGMLIDQHYYAIGKNTFFWDSGMLLESF
jgi:hypothetical protein